MIVPPWSITFALAFVGIFTRYAESTYSVPGNLIHDLENDCDIEYQHRMRMLLLEPECESEGHCWDASTPDKNCYRKRSDLCYLPNQSDRIYLALNLHFECGLSNACHDPDALVSHRPCYLKKTDVCYIPKEENRLYIENVDNQDDCHRADGCFIERWPGSGTGRCYMKELKCVILPENCVRDPDAIVNPCSAECGPGIQREVWRCCSLNDAECTEDKAKTVVVPRPCCRGPCTGPLKPDPLDKSTRVLEEVEVGENAVGAPLAYQLNPFILKVFKVNVIQGIIDNKTKMYWSCAQVNAIDDACKLNNFYKVERSHRPDAEGMPRRAATYFQSHPSEYVP